MSKPKLIYKFRELFYSTIAENKYFIQEEYSKKILEEAKTTGKISNILDVDKIVYEEKLKQLDYRTAEFEKLMEDLGI